MGWNVLKFTLRPTAHWDYLSADCIVRNNIIQVRVNFNCLLALKHYDAFLPMRHFPRILISFLYIFKLLCNWSWFLHNLISHLCYFFNILEKNSKAARRTANWCAHRQLIRLQTETLVDSTYLRGLLFAIVIIVFFI